MTCAGGEGIIATRRQHGGTNYFCLARRGLAMPTAGRIHSSRQLTGLHLLALAVKRGEKLAAFDQETPLSAIGAAGAENLCVT